MPAIHPKRLSEKRGGKGAGSPVGETSKSLSAFTELIHRVVIWLDVRFEITSRGLPHVSQLSLQQSTLASSCSKNVPREGGILQMMVGTMTGRNAQDVLLTISSTIRYMRCRVEDPALSLSPSHKNAGEKTFSPSASAPVDHTNIRRRRAAPG
jgi:hypothetical protein